MSFFNEYPYHNLTDLNLDYILRKMKEYVDGFEELEEWKAQHEAEYEKLKAYIDALNSGDFPESFQVSMRLWLERNAFDIIGSMIKNVYFGLTDTGYFVAYIPESWSDITFNTTVYDIVVELMPEYGHLVLSY